MNRLSPEYRVVTVIVLSGLIAGLMGLACSWQLDAQTTVAPTATVCIEMGAEETAVAYAASLAEGTRQSAERRLTQLAPAVPGSVCPTATAGPNMEKTMSAELATLSAERQSQP